MQLEKHVLDLECPWRPKRLSPHYAHINFAPKFHPFNCACWFKTIPFGFSGKKHLAALAEKINA
jgi:hypothetical protein